MPLTTLLGRFSKSFRRSVRGRLAMMVIAVALPAALLGAALVYQADRNERAATARHILTSARALSALVDREIGDSIFLLKTLATSQSLGRGELSAFHSRAKNLIEDPDEWVVLLGVDGQEVVNTREPFGTPLPRFEINPEMSALLKAGKPAVSNLLFDPVAQALVVHTAYPVFRDGHLEYSIHLVMLTSVVRRMLKLDRLDPTSVVSVIDADGRVAARSLSADRYLGKKAPRDVVESAHNAQEGIGDSVTLEGLPVQMAFSRSVLSGWTVVIGVRKAELYASARRLAWIGLTLTAVLVLVAVMMASWIGYSLAREVEMLASDATTIGRGAIPVKTETHLEETHAVANALYRTADRLDLALSASQLGLWSWEANTDLVTFSERAAEIFGTDREITWSELRTRMVEDDAERARLAVKHSISRNEQYAIEYRVRKPGRGVRWLAVSGRPTTNDDGAVSGMIGTLQDITERKASALRQEALYDLASSVNRAAALSEIYNATVDAICRCQQTDRAAILIRDVDSVIRFKVFRNLSDQYRRAVEGHVPWREDDPSPQTLWIEDVLSAELSEGLRASVVQEGIRSLVFIPLTNEYGLLGKLMVYYDQPHAYPPEEIRALEAIAAQVAFAIERQKNAGALEALVDERTTSLRQTVEQMHEFSYSVSHDLRAPVRAMRGYAEAVLEDYGERLDLEGRELLTRIRRNGDRMDRLIQDLLTYSRMTRSVSLEPVELHKLFKEVIQQYPAMQPGIADIEIRGELPTVIAHEPSLTQVVSNLLSNAVKFVAVDVHPRVIVHAESRQERVRIWFSDNGIGISSQHQGRLFGMFERIHPDALYEGTGIGLAIVRKAMERMGGAVGFESDGVSGSQFWIELTPVV